VDQVEQSAIDTANQTLSNITQITGKGPAANTSSKQLEFLLLDKNKHGLKFSLKGQTARRDKLESRY